MLVVKLEDLDWYDVEYLWICSVEGAMDVGCDKNRRVESIDDIEVTADSSSREEEPLTATRQQHDDWFNTEGIHPLSTD